MSIAKSSKFVYFGSAIIAGVAFSSLSSEASAAPPGFFDQSLASQLVQSMAQRRILQTDDAVAADCGSREFVSAQVVQQPVVSNHGGYATKDWQEDWTLNRCGTNVFYRVFYSEIGAGGVTLSVAPLDAAGTPVAEMVRTVADTVPLLRLAKPNMRGDEVKRLQEALVKAGVKVSTDGVFGPATDKAVKTFQQKQGLSADGVVGKETRDALGL